MAKNETPIPGDYVPYETLVVCSNEFVRGKTPIVFGITTPVLVGKGETPLLWINAPTREDGKSWKPLVARNESKVPEADINVSGREVTVSLGKKKVIQVKSRDESAAEITFMDLRPLGLNIFGDTKGLNVGTNSLIGNKFVDISTMLRI